MTDNVLDFENERRKLRFGSELDKKNTHFMEQYGIGTDVIEELWKERTGVRKMKELGQFPTNQELFGTENEFQQFYLLVLEKLKIDMVKEELTFVNYPDHTDIQHKIGSILFEKKYGETYKDIYPK